MYMEIVYNSIYLFHFVFVYKGEKKLAIFIF